MNEQQREALAHIVEVAKDHWSNESAPTGYPLEMDSHTWFEVSLTVAQLQALASIDLSTIHAASSTEQATALRIQKP